MHRSSWSLVLAVALLGCRSETEAPTAPAIARGAELPAPDEPAAPSSQVHGELLDVDGQRVLRVWGTPAQMGYAHGFLLRDAIIEVLEGYALELVPPERLRAVGDAYAVTAAIPVRLREEAQGIVEGMKAAGGARIEGLDRELSVADLLVLNAITDLVAVGCSSVSAWGPATKAAKTLGGAPIVVRNLDWSADPQLLRNQMIVVYEPDDAERQPVVSVAFAGYMGCLSCMNEAGVTALFNMGYGDGAASPSEIVGGFAPANMLLRDTLERRDVDGDGRTNGDDVEAALRKAKHVGSYIVHVVEPDAQSAGRIVEVDAEGVYTRGPKRGSELGSSMLAATNHLREKSGPESCSRYRTIEDRAEEWNREVTPDGMWSLGADVRLSEVVHMVMVEPSNRTLRLWLRGPDEGPRSKDEGVVHTWASLVRVPSTP